MINIPIFLSSDDNYAPFVATTIASICDNTKSFIDFYVLDGGISTENKSKIKELKNVFSNFSIEFINIKTSDLASIQYQNSANHVTLATYNRFLIPLLKPELGKVLYLDVDIIALGDISKLYNEDLQEYSLGAVWDEPFEDTYNVNIKQYLNLPTLSKCFNAGILLIDIEKWHNQNIVEQLFKIEKNYREHLRFADQDVLNKLFSDNYKILDTKYNYLNQYDDYYKSLNINKEIIIRHFNSNVKPWQISPNMKIDLLPHHQNFWNYARKTNFFDFLINQTKNIDTSQKLRLLQIGSIMSKHCAKNKKA